MAILTRAALLAAVALPVTAGGWVEGSIVGVRDDNAKRPVAVYLEAGIPGRQNYGTAVASCYGVLFGGWCQPAVPVDTWVAVDVTGLGVPADAKSVFLSGMLSITHGTTPEICGIRLAFRAPGDPITIDEAVGVSAIAVDTIDGTRAPMATWAPLRDGKFEIAWRRQGTPGDWPEYCAVGANLSLQAYLR